MLIYCSGHLISSPFSPKCRIGRIDVTYIERHAKDLQFPMPNWPELARGERLFNVSIHHILASGFHLYTAYPMSPFHRQTFHITAEPD